MRIWHSTGRQFSAAPTGWSSRLWQTMEPLRPRLVHSPVHRGGPWILVKSTTSEASILPTTVTYERVSIQRKYKYYINIHIFIGIVRPFRNRVLIGYWYFPAVFRQFFVRTTEHTAFLDKPYPGEHTKLSHFTSYYIYFIITRFQESRYRFAED